jgi:hypothetical protein
VRRGHFFDLPVTHHMRVCPAAVKSCVLAAYSSPLTHPTCQPGCPPTHPHAHPPTHPPTLHLLRCCCSTFSDDKWDMYDQLHEVGVHCGPPCQHVVAWGKYGVKQQLLRVRGHFGCATCACWICTGRSWPCPSQLIVNCISPAHKSTHRPGQTLLDLHLLWLQAFPIHTYPQVMLLPDGGLAMSAGNLLVRCCGSNQTVGVWVLLKRCQERCCLSPIHSLCHPWQVKYNRTRKESFVKAYSMAARPGAPWSYPQTGELAGV